MVTRYLASNLVLGFFLLVPALPADTVQLLNGDTITGKVVSLDDKHVKLQSEALGQITIERSKIASIQLGDAPVAKKTVPQTKPSGPQDAIELLRTQGLDPKMISEIKKAFPLLATPEAGKYFDTAVSGLLGGTLNVQDIRRDALKAREEIKKLEKELGPQAAQALQAYIGILDGFLRETEPTKQAPKTKDPAAKEKK